MIGDSNINPQPKKTKGYVAKGMTSAQRNVTPKIGNRTNESETL